MSDDTSKDDKTEEATPKRRQEAREKGQVGYSTEFVASGMLLAALLLIVMGGPKLLGDAAGFMIDGVSAIGVHGTTEVAAEDMSALMRDSVHRVLGSILLLVGPVLLVGTLLGFAQAGVGFSSKAIAMELNKLNPIKGMTRLFSMRSVFRTLLSIAKISAIGTAVVVAAWMQMPEINALVATDLGPALVGASYVVLNCAIGALAAVLALGVVDLLYQRFQHGKDLRMSKQEIKEEHKSTDGDPHVKARIRQVQRELSRRRMMDEVPKATVVVTNPTHFAVALRYRKDGEDGVATGEAPTVVAKGADFVAQKIKAIARENGVVCFEDVTLARALHARVEIGDEIPEDLYQAVAAVLAYVYRVKGAVVPA